MIFYLVPAAAGHPAMLQPTQADANREARERGLKVRAPDMQHDVPTDKAGLMGYVNGLLAASERAIINPADETVGTVTGDPHSEDDRPMNPDVGLDDDGYPKRRSAFTVTQVATCKLGPRSDHVQDLCHHVSKLSGTDLGLVALEVAARLGRIGEAAAQGGY